MKLYSSKLYWASWPDAVVPVSLNGWSHGDCYICCCSNTYVCGVQEDEVKQVAQRNFGIDYAIEGDHYYPECRVYE